MKPYYDREGITIYCGDCREILPQLGPAETVITDPVWPNAIGNLIGSENPEGLFSDFLKILPRETKRLIVQLGCDSDPRFLRFVPDWLPFIRLCNLDYAVPNYKGRILYTGDIAYAFGQPPASIKGRHLLSGRCISTKADPMFMRHSGRNKDGRRSTAGPEDNLPHPAPRRLEHVRWLVSQFTDKDDIVLDPFLVSGTTAVAAKYLNRKCIGIEIEERYCEIAVNRCRQMVFDLQGVTDA